MMTKKISLSIVIPAYNEEDNIKWVVENSLKSLPKFFKDFEIIIVDDGSSDKTPTICDRLSDKYKQVKVVHQNNQGYSRAMMAGIKKSSKEYVAYMPADGQFLVEDMRHCFEAMKDNDMILGYRGGRPDYSTYRIILSYGYLLLLSLLFDIKYVDVGWVIIWKTKLIQKLKLKYLGGIFVLTETLVRFKKKGYKLAEAPSYYRPRRAGQAKNTKLKVVAGTFLDAWRLWWEVRT